MAGRTVNRRSAVSGAPALAFSRPLAAFRLGLRLGVGPLEACRRAVECGRKAAEAAGVDSTSSDWERLGGAILAGDVGAIDAVLSELAAETTTYRHRPAPRVEELASDETTTFRAAAAGSPIGAMRYAEALCRARRKGRGGEPLTAR